MIVADLAQRVDRLLCAHLLVERDEARGHHPAGAGLGVELCFAEFFALVLRESLDHAVPAVLGDEFDEFEEIVDFEASDHGRQALVGQGVVDEREHFVW